MKITLHWYILRELIRVFIMVSVALTVILAFGGTFRPLTKEGLSLFQLLWVLLDLIPAMLAYSIPLSALFAAVIVYWRLATDNEFTGARAGGIGYMSLVAPALLLGMLVGGLDLVFVGYVVPAFLERTQQAIQTDIASLLLHNVGERQPFQFGKIVIYANSAYAEPVPAYDKPPPGIKRQIIQLRALAATPLKHGKPTAIVLAKAANVIIDRDRRDNQVRVGVQLDDGTAFDPHSFRQMQGTIRYLPPDGKPFVIGSIITNRPKFMNFKRLAALLYHPENYRPIRSLIEKKKSTDKLAVIGAWYHHHARSPAIWHRRSGYVSIAFDSTSVDGAGHFVMHAPGAHGVQVSVFRHGRLVTQYRAATATLVPLQGAKNIQAGIKLAAPIRVRDPAINRHFHAGPPTVVISHITLDRRAIAAFGHIALTLPASSALQQKIDRRMAYLQRQILSEFNSRISFAFSCVVLVILGAALGIILQGRNPLAVFVMGVGPAMVLVLLINTGRGVVTRNGGSPWTGLALIWTGNFIILAIDFFVYQRLLRQ
jgi:lipopolysaccharide export LptBFGC system permease protein LptF